MKLITLFSNVFRVSGMLYLKIIEMDMCTTHIFDTLSQQLIFLILFHFLSHKPETTLI